MAHDVAGIVLVDGVCFAGIREPVDRAGKAFERAGCRRNVGAVVAFGCAYLMYPAFLDWAGATQRNAQHREKDGHIWQSRFVWVCVITILASAGLSLGMWKLNTDS